MTFSNDPNEASNEIMRAAREQQERAIALEAVLNHAPDIGIEQALEQFGSSLTDTEKQVLRTLTPEELAALKSILSKIGTQIFRASPFIVFPAL